MPRFFSTSAVCSPSKARRARIPTIDEADSMRGEWPTTLPKASPSSTGSEVILADDRGRELLRILVTDACWPAPSRAGRQVGT